MKRIMMQAYVKNSKDAVRKYCEAFDAKIVSEFKDDEGNYFHVELDVDGHIVALSEAYDNLIVGDVMQFCFHYGEGSEARVQKAYDVLKEGAKINYPLGKSDYSPLMTDLVDQFGIRWCIFV